MFSLNIELEVDNSGSCGGDSELYIWREIRIRLHKMFFLLFLLSTYTIKEPGRHEHLLATHH